MLTKRNCFMCGKTAAKVILIPHETRKGGKFKWACTNHHRKLMKKYGYS